MDKPIHRNDSDEWMTLVAATIRMARAAAAFDAARNAYTAKYPRSATDVKQ